MEIITFSASKGGVGKTTISFNFGAWLAHNGNQVLLVDSDYQANLSSTFNVFTNEGTLLDVFTGGNPVIHKITDTLDLLPASMRLDSVEQLIHDKRHREELMLIWLKQNIDLIKKYDYIIMDTHPEFGLLTKNMIQASDYVFVPLEPSEYGFQQSRNQFDLRMNEFKTDSYDYKTDTYEVDAQVYYIANRIKHNTSSSHAFRETLNTMPDVIAQIDERELINSSTLLKKPVADMTAAELRTNGTAAEKLFNEFKKMEAVLKGN